MHDDEDEEGKPFIRTMETSLSSSESVWFWFWFHLETRTSVRVLKHIFTQVESESNCPKNDWRKVFGKKVSLYFYIINPCMTQHNLLGLLAKKTFN